MFAAARISQFSWIALAIPFAAPLVAEAHIDAATEQDYRAFERNDGKGSCCDWLDCRPALEPFMENDGEKIMDRARNKFAFDQDKVVKLPSDDGNWHLCANSRGLICIIAPSQAARQSGFFGGLFSMFDPPQSDAQIVLSAQDIARELATAPICRSPGL
jgi:hypothetical protein